MARPRKAAIDPLNDLQRKTAILEREMTTQRVAMDRLKEIAVPRLAPSAERAGRRGHGHVARRSPV